MRRLITMPRLLPGLLFFVCSVLPGRKLAAMFDRQQRVRMAGFTAGLT